MSHSNTLKVTSPYDQKLIKELPMMDKGEVEKTIKKAHDLFPQPVGLDSRI